MQRLFSKRCRLFVHFAAEGDHPGRGAGPCDPAEFPRLVEPAASEAAALELRVEEQIFNLPLEAQQVQLGLQIPFR